MQFNTLVIEPFMQMLHKVIGYIPTLVISLGILILGYLFAHAVAKLVTHLFKSIEFDTVSEKMGLTKVLTKGGIKHKPSGVLGCLTYWVLMIMVLTISLKALGLAAVSGLIDKLLAYVPSVISGAVVLIFGMLLAKFIATIVYIAAKNTDMPIPATLARLSKFAIVVYVGIIYLKEVGFVDLFVGSNYTIFLTGIVFALALAFGLAGKDIASKYLGVLDHKK